MKYGKLLLATLSFALPMFGNNNIYVWLDAQFELPIIDRLKLKGEQEMWYNEDRLFLEETIFLLEYDVFDWLAVGIGDRLVDEKKMIDGKRQWQYEHRPTLDITLKHKYKGFRFDMRNRFEYRDKESTRRNYLRYRGRFRVRTPWEWTDWRISPYSSWEMYLEDEPSLSTGEMFNKSRSLIGLSMYPVENVHVSLFYLLLHERHGDSGWKPIHVPGIEVKYEF